jgi:hypothetical protein
VTKEFVVKKWKPVGCSVDWSAEMSVFIKTKFFQKEGALPKKIQIEIRRTERQRNITKSFKFDTLYKLK